jgi:hypothetical protein
MRGAGTADHSGDLQRKASAATFNAQEAMTTCALTKLPLFTKNDTAAFGTIVADPYGVLYNKEAAVHALLRRKQQGPESSSSSEQILGPQVRRLADLHDVRFHRENNISQCPITSKALTGSIPAILLVPGKDATPNVLSESALKQLSRQELEEEYGPIQQQVRLAPPPTLLEEIKKQVAAEQDKEEIERKTRKAEKSKKKKRKREEDGGEGKKGDKASDKKKVLPLASSKIKSNSVTPALSEAVQSRVHSTIQQNSVLSSLFTSNKPEVSEKEKKDNLFAR